MKKSLLIISMLLVSFSFGNQVVAQSPKAYPITLDNSGNPASYALPVTTIKVKVVVEKEVIRTGPYARFAQKFLGVMAPLSDKDIYTIKSAEIDYVDPEREELAALERGKMADYSYLYGDFGAGAGVRVLSHVENDLEFTKASPDRTTLLDKSLEDMARDAVNTIYTLRKRRFDLVTGEAGEHVYGEGLRVAIEEMKRMESEYLSLFLGKQAIVSQEMVFDVVPEEGKNNYIVFRFSESSGALPTSDLSATPVVLMIEKKGGSIQNMSKPVKGVMNYYRVAAWSDCRLMDQAKEVATAHIPIYQFGVTVPGR